MRRQLGEFELPFYTFDYACFLYLQRFPDLLIPGGDIGALSGRSAQMMDVLSAPTGIPSSSLLNLLVGLLPKERKKQINRYFKARRVSPDRVKELEGMDSRTELLDELPRCFAQDLKVAMAKKGAPSRVILFFDTMETLEIAGKNESGGRRSGGLLRYDRPGRDWWVRRLFSFLGRVHGIVTVSAGRNRPMWEELSDIAPSKGGIVLELRPIGLLPVDDAREYLARAGVRDRTWAQRLIRTAEIEPGLVHPFYLGLCTDLILEHERRGTRLEARSFPPGAAKKGKEFLRRVLMYVDDRTAQNIRALSASRGFDESIFFGLGKRLNLHVDRIDWERIRQFSFVREEGVRGKGWYRIHQLICRLYQENLDEIQTAAHQFLREHYRQKKDMSSVVESIYHSNRLEWETGVSEWATVFDDALENCDDSLCRGLLDLSGELVVKSDWGFGLLARCRADFDRSMARWKTAKRGYFTALSFFENALSRNTSDSRIRKWQALAQINLGRLYLELAHRNAARQKFQEALETCGIVLRNDLEDTVVQVLRSDALTSLGEIEMEKTNHEAAIRFNEEAIRACEIASRSIPRPAEGLAQKLLIEAINNKGYALSSIGDLKEGLGDHSTAIIYQRKAVKVYDHCLKHFPDDQTVKNNKAFAIMNVADAQLELGEWGKALSTAAQAERIFRELVHARPEDVIAQSNRARNLKVSALAAIQMEKFADCEQLLKMAKQACLQALERSPDDVWARNTMGLVELAAGECSFRQGRPEDAEVSYSEAARHFRESLDEAPEDVEAHFGHGVARLESGKCMEKRNDTFHAERAYQQASRALHAAAKFAPNDQEIRARLEESANALYRVTQSRQE